MTESVDSAIYTMDLLGLTISRFSFASASHMKLSELPVSIKASVEILFKLIFTIAYCKLLGVAALIVARVG